MRMLLLTSSSLVVTTMVDKIMEYSDRTGVYFGWKTMLRHTETFNFRGY